MNDFRVFTTLKLYKNGEFEFIEWTHTNHYSMDFGNWTIDENEKILTLKSKNIKFGVFKNSEFKVGDNEISNLNKRKYEGFFSNLNEEK